MEAAVQLDDVTKSFGQKTAVDGLNLSIPAGGLYGFIGPNGAGKTTTIRMIMSILFPDSGSLSVLGRRSALEAKDRIGYLPEERGVYRKMRVGAFLRYMALLKGVREAGLEKRIIDLLEKVDLYDTFDKRCEDLSKGMSQKIQFLSAIIHEPDLLILDEPFSGLDPLSMRMLRELILSEHRRGATILFSTHVMPQAEEICDHIIMIHESYKVLDEKLSLIHRKYASGKIFFAPLNAEEDITVIRNLQDIEQVTNCGNGYEIKLRDCCDTAAVMQKIAAAVPPAHIELSRPSLEDIFVQIVSGSSASIQIESKLRTGLHAYSNGEHQ